MKAKHGTIINVIRELCSRENGCSLREAADAVNRPMNVASTYLSKQIASELTKAGCHGEYRYFTDADAAAKYHVVAVAKRAEQLRLSKIRKNNRRAEKHRNDRIKARAEKGLPPYDPNNPSTVKPSIKGMTRAAKKAGARRKNIDPKPSGLTLSTRAQDQERKRDHKQATIIWPEHVKVQKAPTPRDDRFTFTPPSKDWRGVISQDQQERWAA